MRADERRSEKPVGRRAWVWAVLAVAALWVALPAGAQESGSWQFEVSPYLWGSGLQAHLTAGDQSASASASFKDVLKDLQFAFMGHVEARNGRWGILVDPVYVSLGKSGTGPHGLKTDVDLRQTVLTAAGSYRFYQGERSRADLLFGGKYLNVETDLRFLGFEGFSDLNWIPDRHKRSNEFAPLLGLRTETKLGERWIFQFRANVAANGDLTFVDGAVRFDRELKKGTSLSFGYIYTNTDGSAGSDAVRLKYDITLAGPFLGLAFRF